MFAQKLEDVKNVPKSHIVCGVQKNSCACLEAFLESHTIQTLNVKNGGGSGVQDVRILKFIELKASQSEYDS